MRKLGKAVAIACVMSLASMTALAAGSGSTVRNSSSGHSGSSTVSHAVQAGTTAQTTTPVSTTATQVLANGQTVTVLSPVAGSNGSLEGGLVANGTASVALGDAKRAGLPSVVVSALDAVDNGSLAGLPVSAAGKKPLTKTVALTKVVAGSTQQLVVAKDKIPATGVQVLFYNNTNNTFTLLPATVDATTGLVTFTAPADGTAAVVG